MSEMSVELTVIRCSDKPSEQMKPITMFKLMDF